MWVNHSCWVYSHTHARTSSCYCLILRNVIRILKKNNHYFIKFVVDQENVLCLLKYLRLIHTSAFCLLTAFHADWCSLSKNVWNLDRLRQEVLQCPLQVSCRKVLTKLFLAKSWKEKKDTVHRYQLKRIIEMPVSEDFKLKCSYIKQKCIKIWWQMYQTKWSYLKLLSNPRKAGHLVW